MAKRRIIAAACTLAATMVLSTAAHAGGYDTPILYSARHIGMAGTAVASVSDSSAIFHNPAGLARIGRGNLLLDLSIILGRITSSPAAGEDGENVESELSVAPFFLLGGAGRVTDWLVLGLGVYPVASSGGAYEYPYTTGSGTYNYINETTLFFIEIAPTIAFNIPGRITLGASYRMTLVSFTRLIDTEETDPSLDIDMFGTNFLGFKVGAQWEAIEDHLSIGLMYRHHTRTEIAADEINAGGMLGTFTDATFAFVLPSRIAAGIRGDYMGIGLAFDFEYAWQSQNRIIDLAGIGPTGDEQAIPNVYNWQNAVTLRVGAEYNIELGNSGILTPRLGYIFDDTVSNPEYPSSFGAPPGPSHIVTAGLGYDGGPWQVNVAYAFRMTQATVTQEGIDAGEDNCPFCSFPGEYDLRMNGMYVDFSWDWE